MTKYQVDEFLFDLDLTKPLYEQILVQIRHAIARGEVTLGTRIPSVRDLAQQLKVNPNTVMRAYQELERDRLCETRRGQGTFITTSEPLVVQIRKDLAQEAVQTFITAMKDLGIDRRMARELIEEAEW